MMYLRSISIEGFRTFSQKQAIKFPSTSGLYLMRGENLVDSRLQGNDVGKSTFWDAVYWGLYGTTTRGLRAGNVVSWGSKKAIVEQVWEVNGENHVIRREQNPNGLWLDGKKLEGSYGEGQVGSIVGLTAAEFLHSVLFGQFNTHFLDLGPSDKLKLFSDVLSLDYWEDLAEEAKGLSSQQAEKAQRLDSKMCSLDGSIKSQEEQKRLLLKEKALWDKKVKTSRKELAAVSKAKRAELSELNIRVEQLHTKQDGIKQRCIDCKDSLKDLEVQYHTKKQKLKELQKDLEVEQCPYCHRKLGDSWKQKLQLTTDKLSREVEDLEEDVAKCRDRVEGHDRRFDRLVKKLSGLYKRVFKLQSEIESAKDKLDQFVANPHSKTLKAIRQSIAEDLDGYKLLKGKYNKACEVRDRQQYWVKGFRDLRLWVLDSSLAELEMMVNNSLSQLGLDRWLIHFGVEKENKSGGVTKGFLVDVSSPESGSDTQWRGWGGGVSQRLKVAAEIGLGHLIADRKGVDIGIEVMDEPTQHLSEQGVYDLLTHLQARSREEDKQIWLVDHRVLQFPFDGGILVKKTETGSELSML